MIRHPWERLLDRVHNPSQYLGNEVHSVVKERSGVSCRIALCFPELYSIGMSHLGLKILYSVLNRSEGLWAERFFHPEPDMERLLREEGETLRSLESHDPLSAFDIVGFSITTELCFTGILAMLDLGGVPLKRADRGANAPLVIGGGAAVFNPEPVVDFFDLFVLGDAEETLPRIAREVAALKKGGSSREELLRSLSGIEGVCVPSLFNVEYHGARLRSISSTPGMKKPRRVALDTLSKSPFPFDMVVPYGQPVFDRLSVEIDRGCTQGCRYCQAGMTYRPVRERAVDDIVSIIEQGVKTTGFDDVTLASLSSGDYSSIEQLVTKVMNATEEGRVSVSLPSIRSGTLTENLIHQVGRVRRTGFTITAEAGSERLRRVINKKITDEEILGTARKVLAGGWRILKLYFMIGLPTETEEDVEGIVGLVERINSLKEGGRRFQTINVGVSQFVPKAHTPFQWVAMENPEELHRKKELLYRQFGRMKAVKMKGHEVRMSYLEGVFSRGDRRLAAAVLGAYRKGCRLDGWSEHFNFDAWTEAFRDAGINPDEYALRPREKEETLPWDYIDVGVTKKYLWREWECAKAEKESEDCRHGSCLGCGLPANDNIIQPPADAVPTRGRPHKAGPKTSYRYRLRFRKEGMARFLSHLEMTTAFSRAFRRAGLPLAWSQGFHPHLRLSFGPALPVGVASLAESLDLETETEVNPEEIRESLNGQLENGLEVDCVERLAPPYRSIQSAVSHTVWELVDSGEGTPSMDEVVVALESLEGVKVYRREGAGGEKILRVEVPFEGILPKLKKLVPGFALGANRRLIKCAIVAKKSS